MVYKTNSSSQTKKLAASLAERFLKKTKKSRKNALAVALTGELGSGKTTFIQGFIKAAGIKERITSPTFVLIKKFKIKNLRFKKAYHIDCYRIIKPKEILDLGFREAINNPQNIVLIEWAERIKNLLPRNVILIKFNHSSIEKERILEIKNKI